MMFSNETIIALYKETLANGEDPIRQIKSLAKSNGVKATFIKKILADAGLEVPEHIPTGPMKKDDVKEQKKEDDFSMADADYELQESGEEIPKAAGCLKTRNGSCEGCDDTDLCFEYERPKIITMEPRKAAVINEDFEAAVQGMIKESEGKSPITRQESKEDLASIPEPVIRHLTIAVEALIGEAVMLEREAKLKREEAESINAFLGRDYDKKR